MRLLIYLLAMLTGFSVAEAARPVVAVPASVDTAVGQAYATVAINVAEQVQVRPVSSASVSASPSAGFFVGEAFPAVIATTPVLRHDIILG